MVGNCLYEEVCPTTWCPEQHQSDSPSLSGDCHLDEVRVAAGEVGAAGRRRGRRAVPACLLHVHRVYQRRALTVRSILLIVHLSLVTLRHGGVARHGPHRGHQLHLPGHDVVNSRPLSKRVRAATVADEFSKNNRNDI